MKNNELKILCIGNSFSEDTTAHLAEIALLLGISKIKVANLYVGGCSINQHCFHAEQDMPAYRYDLNMGNGWQQTPNFRISDAIKSDDWDWISIQHGTGDGSRYTEIKSYEKLSWLIAYIKGLAHRKTKIAFNMTWVGEPDFQHEEIRHYGGDQLLIYNKIAELTKEHILTMPGIDVVSPTGTAIQNARTGGIGLLTRDGYHLSLDTGRYIAAMTFLKALTDTDVSDATFIDDARVRMIAVEAVNNAITDPFRISSSRL
jgi:hypothetical protein